MSTPSASTAAPVSLFYSYAHEDAALRDELQGHLKILERRKLLAPWHDREIVPGTAWAEEIDAHLRSAELVLLLVSKDFIASDYIFGVELQEAMRRHERKEAEVVPILVRSVDVSVEEDSEDLPFLKLQGLPSGLRPVTSWPNRDEAWTDVAKGLRATVNAIRARRAPAAPVAAAAASARIAPAAPAAAAPDAFAVPDAFTARAPQAVEKSASALGAAAQAPEPADPILQGVIDGVVSRVQEARAARQEAPLRDGAVDALRQGAMSLIDMEDARRVLWVDDRPRNNVYEAGMLARLQIEVVPVRSTDEALQALAQDREGFDLVISDWDRPGDPGGGGMDLLRKLRAQGRALPLVFYHAAQGERRAQRAREATEAGALGEAVMPDELLALVRTALADSA